MVDPDEKPEPASRKRRTSHKDKPVELLIFAHNFKQARLAAGLTQTDITKRIGVSQAYVSEVERAVVDPSLTHMALLARVVGKPLHELLKPSPGK
ncbi:helix-turn-helix transcriptional regulator [Azospirillum sp. CT11-132]|jgi:transcriptional regulator with XRE-family HTH domain|uniref:helix-turn-helix transcriptional regulator n=1 Tax=Azospirillum sp. CT11-132 TaxID=3396317 RepID=UPI0039A73702